MRKNLVIVPAGDGSLHTEWLAAERSYDIWVIYYGKDAERARQYRGSSDGFFQGEGLKIQLARNFILGHAFFKNKIDFTRYECVWFPDDDIRFPDGPAGLEQLFDTARRLQADVFQPAIENEHYSRGWEATRRVPGAACHRTNIVEVMAHGFTGAFFASAYLPAIHSMYFMKSGWGLEPIWMKVGEALLRRPLRTFVIDCCPIIHTRPVGTGNTFVHNQGRWETTFLPQIETNRMKTLAVYASLAEAAARKDEFGEVNGVMDVSTQPVTPTWITAPQARRAIVAAGLKSIVEAAVANASPEIQELWYTMDTLDRDDPDLIRLATSIGVTPDQIDALFRQAALM
jgi:hypothetical protein